MKYICLNLKRFDVPKAMGGVNSIADIMKWGEKVVGETADKLEKYKGVQFFQYLPEAHLIPALKALPADASLSIGCQGLHWQDIAIGGNFGAFTSLKPATAMKALGVKSAIIGHCEERRAKNELLKEAGASDSSAVDRMLNKEAICAVNAGLTVLFCIGEQDYERPYWQELLSKQIEIGLTNLPKDKVIIAYEPVWAIGPGKTPPDRATIQETAKFIKEKSGNLPLIYGGGLKVENAEMLASIPEIDGGLIALTRFSGDIGFYPQEYLDIIAKYLGDDNNET